MIALNDPKFRSLFGRCQNPKVIVNKYSGQPVLTSCGHCPNCIAIKAQKQSLMCNVHQSLYKYCYFITLTYANKYIPTVRLFQSHDILSKRTSLSPDEPCAYNMLVDCKRLDIHGDYLGTVLLTASNLELLQSKCELNGSIPFSYLPDLQRFFKRLRYYLTKFNSNDFSYYAVSEYGPVHFRPHYHLLLFSNSDFFSQNLYRCVAKAWKYGRFDFQLADSNASGYLTDYVNSATYLPPFYQNKAFKPFCVHSSYFASLLPVVDKNAFLDDPYRYINETLFPVHGKYVSIPLFRSCFSKLLPKVVGFHCKDIHQLYYDYTAYSRLSEYLSRRYKQVVNYTPSQLADIFCDISCPWSGDDSLTSFWNYIRTDLCRNDDELFSDPDRLHSLLYRYFKVSYDFHKYLCDSDSRFAWIRVKMIYNYYRRVESEKLRDFYDMMSRYSADVSTDVSSFYYFNHYKTSTYDSLSSYPHSDFTASLKSNPIFVHSCTYYSDLCSQMVKHKELNDRNRIFMNI